MASTDLFTVATGSSEPIYRQLVEQVRRHVAGGQMRAGEELPSVRELAQALAVNPMTVSKAFGLLEAEGLLQRRRGQAMVVADLAPRRLAGRIELLRPALERAAVEARQLQVPADDVLALLGRLLNEEDEREERR